MNTNAFEGSQWRVLAGVGIGYGIATALIFVVLFLLPYLVVRAL
ncbi:hypothetical protein [Halorubrum sp. DTA98]